MGFSQKKFNFLSQTIIMIATVLLISALAFPTNSSAEVVNDEALQTQYLDVKSPIVLEFNTPVKWNSALYTAAPTGSQKDHPGINLTETTSGDLVSISMKIDSANPNKLIITPAQENPWKSNRSYVLSIFDHIVLDLSDNQVLTPTTYNIGTKSLTFQQLMFEGDIHSLIEDFTPRNIKVTAPLRYLKELEVIHKIKDDTTESITNIDTVIDTLGIKNGEIKKITVDIFKPATSEQPRKWLDGKEFENLSASKKVYDVGFTKLPDDEEYDVEVTLYGETDDIVLDKRVIKVPVNKDKPVTDKKRFSTAGKSYTLYDLIDKPTNLQSLLLQNSMDELKVQVVHQ